MPQIVSSFFVIDLNSDPLHAKYVFFQSILLNCMSDVTYYLYLIDYEPKYIGPPIPFIISIFETMNQKITNLFDTMVVRVNKYNNE